MGTGVSPSREGVEVRTDADPRKHTTHMHHKFAIIDKVGQCTLTVSKPELKAPMLSALETTI
jgi:hypothetical protein